MVKLTLRLPAALHQLLVKLAADNQRSLNAQIIYLLGQYLGKHKEQGNG